MPFANAWLTEISMQIREIEYIAAIAECGSFSKAASRLFISQPALSQAIRQVEERLGVILLTRTRNAVVLTDAGERIMHWGNEILAARKKIHNVVEDMKDMTTGALTIGISPFYGKYYISRLLPMFARKYPGIRLKITEEISKTLEEMIIKGSVDFAIIALPVGNPKITTEILFEEELYLAVSKLHPINKAAKPDKRGGLPRLKLVRFKNDDFVMAKEGQRLYSIGMELCRKAGFEPNIVFQSRNIETINAFIAEGMGVGFIPEAVKHNCLPEHHANYFQLEGMRSHRGFGIAYRKGDNLSRAARACIAFAKEHVAFSRK